MAVLTGLTAGPHVGTATAPDAGDDVTALSIQVVAQALLNDSAFLNADKFSQTGGGTISGATTFTANVDVNGFDLLIKNGSTFTVQASTTIGVSSTDVRFESGSVTDFKDGSTVKLMGRTLLSDVVDLADTSHVLYDSVTSKRNYLRMLTPPAANRVLTLPQPVAWTAATVYTNGVSVVKNGGNVYTCDTTGTSAGSVGPTGTSSNIVDGTTRWDYVGVAPRNGDWFKVTVMLSTSGFTVGLQRAGSVDYVGVIGDGIGGTGNQAASLTTRFDGTDWKLIDVGGRYAFYGADS
jgi:hypothetical protein